MINIDNSSAVEARSPQSLDLYKEIFGITSSAVDIDRLTGPDVRERLEEDGFVIARDVIDQSAIEKMRDFWSSLAMTRSWRTNLLLGEKNYSHRFFGRYTRHFDFYWNPPFCQLTREISLLLHYGRNIASGYDPCYGLFFHPERTGIYLAVTHYPPKSGEMALHVDPNYFLDVHYNVPLSFRGRDYRSGGLRIKISDGFFDVDDNISRGDVLLFKGAVPHEVQRVEGAGSESALGRLQMFAIPTQFSQKKPKTLLREILEEVYGRVVYGLYERNIGFREDHRNFR